MTNNNGLNYNKIFCLNKIYDLLSKISSYIIIIIYFIYEIFIIILNFNLNNVVSKKRKNIIYDLFIYESDYLNENNNDYFFK